MPSNNAVIAWISCLCFFWPLGLVAISKSMESDRCAGRGDMEGARLNGEVRISNSLSLDADFRNGN